MSNPEEDVTHVSLDCTYYQGNRVIETARCGSCRQEVHEDETHCSSCSFKLDWDNEMESGYGSFLSMYR